MSEKVSPEVLGDELAVSLARCVTAANGAAKDAGGDLADCLLRLPHAHRRLPVDDRIGPCPDSLRRGPTAS